MKKIFKLSTLALLLIAGVSCENDDQTIAIAKGGPQLITPLNGSAYVLDAGAGSNEITTLVWNHADYDVQTAVNYEVEVALADTEFASPVSAGTTNNRFIVWSHEALNAVALEAGLIPYTAGDLDVRIKSSLGTNSDLVAYSNVITITVTPFTTDLPKLAVPGNHQGWSDANNFETAPRIAASGFGQTDYEGYMWLDGEFKFLAPNSSGNFAWGNTDWGDNGDFSGVLIVDNESNCTAVAGYYRVKANTTDLTYSATPVVWGIVGSATPGSWDNSTNLTYDPATKKWSGIVALTAGEFKFRANNSWDINLGPFRSDASGNDFAGENMSYGGGVNFASPGAGNYLVELDLSNPRAYTYTLTPQ